MNNHDVKVLNQAISVEMSTQVEWTRIR